MGQDTQPACVRVLHCGNLLIDRPMPGQHNERPGERRTKLRDAFCKLMQQVDDEKINLVIFSGGLLNHDTATNDTLLFLRAAFETRPKCHFVICPGPNDRFCQGSLYASGRFPMNVHIFTEEILSRFDFDEINTTVYGWGFVETEHRFSPLLRKRVSDTSRLNVLCGTGTLDDPESVLCPIASAEVERFGADYVALTGRTYGGFQAFGRSTLAYSGSFEGTDFDDLGPCGVNLITATPLLDGWQVAAKRQTVDTYYYAEAAVDVSHAPDIEAITSRIRARIGAAGYGKKTALRIILQGALSPDFPPLPALDATAYGVYMLEICDKTTPTDGAEFLLREMTARGELYRSLLSRMLEGDEEAVRAFRIGYAALCGKDVTVY